MNEIKLLTEIRDILLTAILTKKGLKPENDFLTSAEVASLLKISTGHFVNVISKKPGFPTPLSTSKSGRKMWMRSDVVGFLHNPREEDHV